MNVLLVEDDRSQLKLYTDVLERAGYLVAQADSLPAALALLARTTPEAIVSDYDLGVDPVTGRHYYGTELQALGLPLVIMSGYDRPKGYQGPWLLKPLDFPAFVQSLEPLLRRPE